MGNHKKLQLVIKFVYSFVFFIGAYSTANAQQLLWERIFDNGEENISNSISTDSDDNIIIAGFSGYPNGLIVKYNSEGDTLWTCLNDVPISAVACDSEKNIIVFGTMYIEDSMRVCILKYDPEGNLLWRQQTKGINIFNGHSSSTGCLAIDSKNNIVIAGIYLSDEYDYLTLKFNSDGDLIWYRTYQDAENYCGAPDGVAIDKSDNIIITGRSIFNRVWNWRTLKYDQNGDLLWAVEQYRTSCNDYAYGVTSDQEDNIIVVGYVDSLNTKWWPFIIKYTPDGDTLWTKKFQLYPDSYDFSFYDVVTDSLDNIIICGIYRPTSSWGEYFVCKLDQNGNLSWTFNEMVDTNLIHYVQDMAIDDNGDIFVTGAVELNTCDCYTIKIRDIVTDIGDNKQIPQKFSLYPNIPNPFNAMTTLKYQLIDKNFVDLTIYDLLGRKIITLVSQMQSPGIHALRWNAFDIPSGIYIACLKAGNRFSSQKIVLLK